MTQESLFVTLQTAALVPASNHLWIISAFRGESREKESTVPRGTLTSAAEAFVNPRKLAAGTTRAFHEENIQAAAAKQPTAATIERLNP